MEMQYVLWAFIALQWIFILMICSAVVVLFAERKEVERAITFILEYIKEQEKNKNDST